MYLSVWVPSPSHFLLLRVCRIYVGKVLFIFLLDALEKCPKLNVVFPKKQERVAGYYFECPRCPYYHLATITHEETSDLTPFAYLANLLRGLFTGELLPSQLCLSPQDD